MHLSKKIFVTRVLMKFPFVEIIARLGLDLTFGFENWIDG